VGEYVDFVPDDEGGGGKKEEENDDEMQDVEVKKEEQGRQITTPRTKIPSLRRMNSERRRRERNEVEELGMRIRGVKREGDEGVKSDDVAVEEGDDEMDMDMDAGIEEER
jgi:hypothetical protein